MSSTRFVWLRLFATLFLAASMTATAVADEWKDEAHGNERQEHNEKPRSKGQDGEPRGDDGDFHEHGSTTLGMPPGHLPPPGQCRLWYPDRPSGHQPPPEGCGRLRDHAPAGTWLIDRPADRPPSVKVSVYDADRPGIVITIGPFDVGTGAFLGGLRPR